MEDKELNDNFDIALKFFSEKITLNEGEIKKLYKGPINPDVLIDKLVNFGLIKRYSESSIKEYTLTQLGHEVQRAGSWTMYQADKEEEKRLIAEQIKSAILTNQSSITTNKTTKIILGITVFISAVGAWVSWLNYDFVRTHQEPSRRMIDSLSNQLIDRQNQTLEDLRQILKTDSSQHVVK